MGSDPVNSSVAIARRRGLAPWFRLRIGGGLVRLLPGHEE